MGLFTYHALDQEGNAREGTIDVINIDVGIAALQRRGLVVSKIDPVEVKRSLKDRIPFFDRVSNADVVVLSRQITVLFEAQISALRAFRLLAAEARTPQLADRLGEIPGLIQGRSSFSASPSTQPRIFSPFYVTMVRAGEETGKLDETFLFLADYLDRNYELTQK